jgi:hypothetical protein
MLTVFLVACFALLSVALVRRRSTVDGMVSPLSVAMLSLAFYAMAVPFELWLRGETVIGFTGYSMDPEVAEVTLLAGLVGLISLYAGYASITRKSRAAFIDNRSNGVRRARWTALLFAIVGMAVLIVLFRENVSAARDYSTNIEQTAIGGGGVGYFVVNRWTYLSYGVFAFLSVSGSGRPVGRLLVLVLPLIFWSVYSNDKDPLLVAVLVASALVVERSDAYAQPSARLVGMSIAAAPVALALGAATFGAQRAGDRLSVSVVVERLRDGIFVNVDPAGPAVVHALTLSSPGGEGSFRPTLTGMITWLPSQVRPIAPSEDLATTFAKHHWPNWQPGYGYGFSPLAEGWQAAGVLGVALVMLLVGIFFGAGRNMLLPRLAVASSAPSAIRVGSFHVVLGYLAFTAMRGTLTALLSNALICALLVTLLTFAARVATAEANSMVPLREVT